jgi:hypothetical protein
MATLETPNVTTDGLGYVTAAPTSSVTIEMRIYPLTDKERQLLGIGVETVGQFIGYFKASYEELGTTYTVEPGDVVTDENGVKYRVEQIAYKGALGGTEIYRKCVLQRIS